MTALLALLLLASSPAVGQMTTEKPAATNEGLFKSSVSPTMTILIIAISGSLFLLAFFSIYFSRCTGSRSAVTPATAVGFGAGRSRRRAPKGLDAALLWSFPTIVCSDVRGHKLGKVSLECAVCLCEFEDEDILRLLPGCGHVFHCDCIDVWLDTHVTCPICRCDLAAYANDPLSARDNAAVVVLQESANNGDLELDLADLVRIGSQRRVTAGSVSGIPLSSRSTGDWAAIMANEEGRYKLQLSEDIWREIERAGRLRRSASFSVSPVRGEGNSPKGFSEGRGGGWRSLRLAQSARFPILWRSMSAKGRQAAVSGSLKSWMVSSDKGSLEFLHGGEGSGGGGEGKVKLDYADTSPAGCSPV